MNKKVINILIIRLSSLGDIIHTYPMIYDIKNNIKNCNIDWLVDENFAQLVEINPLVDNVIKISLRTWKKNKFKFLKNIVTWKNSVKSKRYDFIIDSQGLLKSALLAKCFNGQVYGYDKNSIREKAACFIYDYKYNIGKDWLAITKNRLLAEKIFNYKVNLKSVDFGIEHNKDSNPVKILKQEYVVFFHATSQNSKKYPIVNWAELANYLIKQYKLKIILPFGNEEEKKDCFKIKELIKSNDVYIPEVRFDYIELTGLIERSSFIFGVDTGLTHLANALNKKVIAIYVDTDPEKTGIFESRIAKNIGNKNTIPTSLEVIDMFEKIIKI